MFALAFQLAGKRPFWPGGTGIEWGNLGVLIFFSMSGFLVAPAGEGAVHPAGREELEPARIG